MQGESGPSDVLDQPPFRTFRQALHDINPEFLANPNGLSVALAKMARDEWFAAVWARPDLEHETYVLEMALADDGTIPLLLQAEEVDMMEGFDLPLDLRREIEKERANVKDDPRNGGDARSFVKARYLLKFGSMAEARKTWAGWAREMSTEDREHLLSIMSKKNRKLVEMLLCREP